MKTPTHSTFVIVIFLITAATSALFKPSQQLCACQTYLTQTKSVFPSSLISPLNFFPFRTSSRISWATSPSLFQDTIPQTCPHSVSASKSATMILSNPSKWCWPSPTQHPFISSTTSSSPPLRQPINSTPSTQSVSYHLIKMFLPAPTPSPR